MHGGCCCPFAVATRAGACHECICAYSGFCAVPVLAWTAGVRAVVPHLVRGWGHSPSPLTFRAAYVFPRAQLGAPLTVPRLTPQLRFLPRLGRRVCLCLPEVRPAGVGIGIGRLQHQRATWCAVLKIKPKCFGHLRRHYTQHACTICLQRGEQARTTRDTRTWPTI